MAFALFFDENNTTKVSCTTEHISVNPFHKLLVYSTEYSSLSKRKLWHS